MLSVSNLYQYSNIFCKQKHRKIDICIIWTQNPVTNSFLDNFKVNLFKVDTSIA